MNYNRLIKVESFLRISRRISYYFTLHFCIVTSFERIYFERALVLFLSPPRTRELRRSIHPRAMLLLTRHTKMYVPHWKMWALDSVGRVTIILNSPPFFIDYTYNDNPLVKNLEKAISITSNHEFEWKDCSNEGSTVSLKVQLRQ